MEEGLTRRTFFKVVSAGLSGIILEKYIDQLPDFIKSSISKDSKRTIDIKLLYNGRYIVFPELEKMSFKERQMYWIDVAINNKLEIIVIPAMLLDKNAGFTLGVNLNLKEGDYLVANLCLE